MNESKIYEYYNSYINDIVKPYIKNFGDAKWLTPEDVILAPNSRHVPWEKKYNDPYLQETKYEKTNLAKDIIANGMYWPIWVCKHPHYEKYVVIAGYHRIFSLQKYYNDLKIAKEQQKKFLCIIMHEDHFRKKHIIYKPKFTDETQVIHLKTPITFPIPYDGHRPGAINKESHKALLKAKGEIKQEPGTMFMFKARTYNDLREIVEFTPHWLRNYMFAFKEKNNKRILQSPVLNNEEEFTKWINE